MIHLIRTYPDGVLRRITDEVKSITDEVRQLASDMAETMCAARGVGLAANQIGRSCRMITVETGSEKVSNPLVVVNPVIVGLDGEDAGEEGCLSVPGFYEIIKRAKKVVVQGVDIDEKELTIECSGLLAHAFQHELDHLDGILFVDHLSPVKKQLFKREYAKEKK